MRIHTLQRRSVLLARSALLASLSISLVACSGDEEPGATPSAGSSAEPGDAAESSDGAESQGPGESEGAPKEESPSLPQVSTCSVSVDVSGDVEISWKGEGSVRVRSDAESGSTARYTASNDGALVTIYSPDDEIPYPAVTFSQGKQGFTSVEDDSDEIDVKRNGKAAQAQLVLSGSNASSVDIDVAFTCKPGKSEGKAKNKG